MSILSQLKNGKITLDQAWAQAEAWGASIIAKAPAAVKAAITAGVADVKEGLSVAATVGTSLLDPLIDDAADTLGTAFATAAAAYLGPVGVAITPAGLDGIDRIRDGLKAELDSLALEMKAQLAQGAPAPQPPK